MTPEWDVRARLVQLAKYTRTLEKALADIRPDLWLKQGASETYVKQAESVRSLALHVIAAAGRLAEQPDRLSAALETLFRIEALEQLSGSLAEGILRYQDASIASRFIDSMEPISGSRELLRQHILDVTNLREQEFDVLNAEAQRCRTTVIRQSGNSPQPTSRRGSR